MPRKARIDMAGSLHHLIIRRIEIRRIFRDDQGRKNFLGWLGKILVMKERDLRIEISKKRPRSAGLLSPFRDG